MRRSERLVRITQILLSHPHQLISLTDLADMLDAAKSSLSEDLAIVRNVLQEYGTGTLETFTGASGGIRYTPLIDAETSAAFIRDIGLVLESGDRILAGGYLYMSDVLGRPEVLDAAGRMFATVFSNQAAEVILTVETKGIPLAFAAARYLHLPVVVVRRDQRVTEGSAVSINYVSGSGRRIQTMSLSRRSLKEQSRVLIIDDFMKAGGTAQGLVELVSEFKGTTVGIGVFMATGDPADKIVHDYVALSTLIAVDEVERRVDIVRGNYFEKESD